MLKTNLHYYSAMPQDSIAARMKYLLLFAARTLMPLPHMRQGTAERWENPPVRACFSFGSQKENGSKKYIFKKRGGIDEKMQDATRQDFILMLQ